MEREKSDLTQLRRHSLGDVRPVFNASFTTTSHENYVIENRDYCRNEGGHGFSFQYMLRSGTSRL